MNLLCANLRLDFIGILLKFQAYDLLCHFNKTMKLIRK